MALPLHVATDNEPIPELCRSGLNGPDMRAVKPIADMLSELEEFELDEVCYIDLLLRFLKAIGCDVSANYARNGSLALCSSMMCDAQMRHRSRWAHFLFEDMDRDPARREFLTNFLVQNSRYADNRPADLRRTTIAVRNFLKAGMRIMIDPNGQLVEGGNVLSHHRDVSDEQYAQRQQWIRVYFDTRRRWRTNDHLKRAVTMLGTPTANGWIVLRGAS